MVDERDPSGRMSVREALQVLVDTRRERTVVVTNQGSSRVWPRLDRHPLDFHYNPSTMGGAIPLALGIALGRPDHDVIVVSGDGALLMSLGSLVTVVASGAVNLTVVVLDNGMYEVTGGQRTPGSIAATDYASLARSLCYPTALSYRCEEEWRAAATDTLHAPGPRFISLLVQPADPADMQTPGIPMKEQVTGLSQRLSEASAKNSSNGL